MMVEQITTLGLFGRVMVSIMRRSPRISSRMASQSELEYCACCTSETERSTSRSNSEQYFLLQRRGKNEITPSKTDIERTQREADRPLV